MRFSDFMPICCGFSVLGPPYNRSPTGRSSSTAPTERDMDYDELPQDCLTFVEELEFVWWYQYKVQYFASLIPTQ